MQNSQTGGIVAVPTIGATVDTVQGSGGNVTLDSSGFVSDGDTLDVFIYIEDVEAADIYTDDSGNWTYLGDAQHDGVRATSVQHWRIKWNTSDSTSHLFTTGASSYREAVVLATSGTDATSWAGDSSGATGTSSTASLAAITETTTEFVQLAMCGNWQWNANPTPTGWDLEVAMNNASEVYSESDQDTTSATISVGSDNGWSTRRGATVPTQAGGVSIPVIMHHRQTQGQV